jgi:hypothetical protein
MIDQEPDVNTKDKIAIEDMTMAMCKYVRDCAIELSLDGRTAKGIEESWETVKVKMGRIFTAWHGDDTPSES